MVVIGIGEGRGRAYLVLKPYRDESIECLAFDVGCGRCCCAGEEEKDAHYYYFQLRDADRKEKIGLIS